MNARIWWIAIAAAAMAFTGCASSSDSNNDSSSSDLSGTWYVCYVDGGTDWSETTVFSGSQMDYESDTYTSTGGACSSGGSLYESDSYDVAVGDDFETTLGGEVVTATEANLTVISNGGVYYTIYYIDTSASPNVLYFGDDTGANDGSTDALRPTTLQETKPREKQ